MVLLAGTSMRMLWGAEAAGAYMETARAHSGMGACWPAWMAGPVRMGVPAASASVPAAMSARFIQCSLVGGIRDQGWRVWGRLGCDPAHRKDEEYECGSRYPTLATKTSTSRGWGTRFLAQQGRAKARTTADPSTPRCARRSGTQICG